MQHEGDVGKMRPDVQVDVVDVRIGEEVGFEALNERAREPVLVQGKPAHTRTRQQQDGSKKSQYECARFQHGFNPSKLQCSTTVRAEALCGICTL